MERKWMRTVRPVRSRTVTARPRVVRWRRSSSVVVSDLRDCTHYSRAKSVNTSRAVFVSGSPTIPPRSVRALTALLGRCFVPRKRAGRCLMRTPPMFWDGT
uniref:Uncharacterized protein n=1 Tax=Anopheles maculatus TaxID=74869 RepID=A0A182T2M5_9DIPT